MRHILLTFVVTIVFFGCKSDQKAKGYLTYSGQTMGTYYRITLNNNGTIDQSDIDKILKKVNKSHSTYDPLSVISSFNKSKEGIAIPKKDTTFYPVFKKAKEMYEKTDGAYDPTIYPLIRFWGFGPEKRDFTVIDKETQKEVNLLLKNLGMDEITESSDDDYVYLSKKRKEISLDFSSIAKGYAIDILSGYLNNQGITDYLIDVGGEAKSNGFNPEGQIWVMGINKPKEEASLTDLELAIYLDKMSIATSGNYRNVETVNGVKISHTINPKTGYPERSKLLSATVMATDCMDADAIATSLMVLGLEKSKKLLKSMPGINAVLLYEENGALVPYYTPGFNKYIVK